MSGVSRALRDALERSQAENERLRAHVTKLERQLAAVERRLEQSDAERGRLAAWLACHTLNPQRQASTFSPDAARALVAFLKQSRFTRP